MAARVAGAVKAVEATAILAPRVDGVAVDRTLVPAMVKVTLVAQLVAKEAMDRVSAPHHMEVDKEVMVWEEVAV